MSDWDASFQFCVFDTTRGQSDGHELDKILFFYPTDCPLASQLSLIGLAEGLITFTKIFSPDVPCDVIDSERRLHILSQPEQSLWMMMVLEKGKETGEIGRTNALQSVLMEAHNLFTLFYGSVRALLANNPSGEIARRCLHAFLPDYISDIVSGKQLSMISSPSALQERGMIQALALGSSTALEVQSVVDLLQSWFGSGRICQMLLLFQDLLVSSTLFPNDAACLLTYARMRLTPAAISGASGRSSKRGLPRANSSSSAHSRVSASERSLSGSRSLSREEAASQGSEGFTPRPLQRDKWWRDQDGFLVTDAWGVEAQGTNAISPTVWLQQFEERMQLVAYQHRQLTLIFLIPVVHLAADAEGSQLLRNQVLDKASSKLSFLEERLSKEWGGTNATHVPGYRYLWVDRDNRLSKASPSTKIATLTKDSMLSLDKVRAEIDASKARFDRELGVLSYEIETCVRTRSNAWVVVRIHGKHELYLVLERASETLLLTAEATEKFSRRHCDGMFASD